MTSNQRGFTLIELMITVAIIAILTAVAYPSYTKYLARAKRAAAEGVLQSAASKQEQYLLNARTYFPTASAPATTTTLAPLGVNVPTEVSTNYDFTAASDNTVGVPPTFYVEAAPKGTQATNDARCGTLRLTNKGDKTATGGAPDCW